MLHRLRLYAVLVTWLLATGAQWDVLQVFAWGRMVAIYSQNMSVLEAVQLTFSREGRCSICRAVETAKEQEQQQAGALPGDAKTDPKPLLFLPPGETPRLFVASQPHERPAPAVIPLAERATPPVPPPRAA